MEKCLKRFLIYFFAAIGGLPVYFAVWIRLKKSFVRTTRNDMPGIVKKSPLKETDKSNASVKY